MVGIDDLTGEEYISLLIDKLNHSVVKKLDSVFSHRNPVLTWGGVTKEQLHECLMEEFGAKWFAQCSNEKSDEDMNKWDVQQ